MNEQKVYFNTIAARLERAIECNVGMHGLEVLLSGWNNHRVRHGYGRINFAQREQDDLIQERYLFLDELIAFSRYAGYNLTRE